MVLINQQKTKSCLKTPTILILPSTIRNSNSIIIINYLETMAATAPAQRCFVVFTAFDFDDEPRSDSLSLIEAVKDMNFTAFPPLFLQFLPSIQITATLRLRDLLSFDPKPTADDSPLDMNRVKFVGADVSRKIPPLRKHTGSSGDATAGTRR